MGEEIAADPAINKMISDYNDEIACLYSDCSDDGGGLKNASVPESESLKLAACVCHSDIIAQWKTTAHAKAFSTLVKNNKQFEPKCLQCHTTRFDEPDGFNMKQQQMNLVNIQCESCHGLADEHLSSMKPIPTKKPTLDVCKKCHNTPDRCPDCNDQQKMFGKIKHK